MAFLAVPIGIRRLEAKRSFRTRLALDRSLALFRRHEAKRSLHTRLALDRSLATFSPFGLAIRARTRPRAPMGTMAPLVLTLLAVGCTCGPEPRGPASEPSATTRAEVRFDEVAGGLWWHADPPLVSRRPSSPMRAAEYGVEGHPEAELTVFHFGAGEGGSRDENVQRWLDQLEQPDGRPTREVASIEQGESHGVALTLVDARGTFVGMRGSARGERHEDWRLLGAIAEGPEGMVFFKLTGPDAAIEDAEPAFRDLVESIRR